MCKICRITRMDFTGSTDRNYPVCSECKERFNKWKRIDVLFFSLKDTGDREFRAIMEEFRIDFAKNLPVWYRKDDCNKRDPQYHLPEELIGLSVGEEMLIQRYSTYVPVVRYNKGQLGCKGHVCCFPQDGDDVFMELPRLPKSVNIVHVVKHYKGDNNEKILHVYYTKEKSTGCTTLVEGTSSRIFRHLHKERKLRLDGR